MRIGIVGLGLIGGSFAKAYHSAGWEVLGHDTDASAADGGEHRLVRPRARVRAAGGSD